MTLLQFERFFMKPNGYRIIQKDERIYNCRVFRGRCVLENAFKILPRIYQVLITTVPYKQSLPLFETLLHESTLVTLYYTTLYNKKDENHRLKPRAWREFVQFQDVQVTTQDNNDTKASSSNGREFSSVL